MKDTDPILTESEAAELARILDALGPYQAARAFELDVMTLHRALARRPLLRGTAVLVRRGIGAHEPAVTS